MMLNLAVVKNGEMFPPARAGEALQTMHWTRQRSALNNMD